MRPLPYVARVLATAFLCGTWTKEELLARGRLILNRSQYAKLLPRVVAAVIARFGEHPPVPRWSSVAHFLAESESLCHRARDLINERHGSVLDLPSWQMQPARILSGRAPVVAINSAGELAEWLGLTIRELDWFASTRRSDADSVQEPLQHYRYRWIEKHSGHARLLEIPKPRLKRIQRQVLHGILDRIPPHAAAHAYRADRSILTYVRPHIAREIVLYVDLREFFPTIRASRVHALFHTVGYPESVARLLTGLCTSSVPKPMLLDRIDQTDLSLDSATHHLYQSRHLPQGAPSSPSLANLCAYRLDVRLSALAIKFDLNYSRYADDLLFSGDASFERSLTRFRILVCAIAIDEGFFIRSRKTRVLRRSDRQQVAGVVLNQRPNPPRQDYDQLKAQLFNCARFGPSSQNLDQRGSFREHLRGRVAWMSLLNSHRGEKLLSLFNRIDWSK